LCCKTLKHRPSIKDNYSSNLTPNHHKYMLIIFDFEKKKMERKLLHSWSRLAVDISSLNYWQLITSYYQIHYHQKMAPTNVIMCQQMIVCAHVAVGDRWSCHWLRKDLGASFQPKTRFQQSLHLIKQRHWEGEGGAKTESRLNLSSFNYWKTDAKGFLFWCFSKDWYVSFKVYLGVLLSRFSWIFCMEDSTIIARDWWFCFRWFNCWKDFLERETRIQFQKGMFPSRMNSLTLWSFMSNQEFFSSPFLGTSLDNCSLLGFLFRLFKMDSGYLSIWLVGGTCGGTLRRWRKMRHWKAYRIWPWPFPIYLFFLVK